MKYLFTTLVFVLFFSFGCDVALYAQAQKTESLEKPVSATLFMIDFAYQFPGGDMADRFGSNANIGGGILRKTKGNFFFGADVHFLFNNNIKEDSVAYNLFGSQGSIIGVNGVAANVNFFQRGLHLSAKIGKLFPLSSQVPNSGLLVLLSGGYLSHKIRIEDKNEAVPQIRDEYVKGYDRLTAGPSVTQFVGYLHLDPKKRINFYIGAEFTQAFTQSQRSFNFDTQRAETDRRTDLLFGVRVGWILPVYKKVGGAYYTN